MQLESSRITRYTTSTATSSNPLRILSSRAHQALPHRRRKSVCPSVLSVAATEYYQRIQRFASTVSEHTLSAIDKFIFVQYNLYLYRGRTT
jgi:hypothetical protein